MQPLMESIRARVRYRCRKFRNLSEDDLVQATWVRLLENDRRALLRYDPSISSPSTYVGRIADRVVIDFARKKQPRCARDIRIERLIDTHSNIEHRIIAKDQAEKFHMHLRRVFPERGRTIYILHFIDGAPITEIATTLGVREQVVHNWIFKIRTLARKFFGACHE